MPDDSNLRSKTIIRYSLLGFIINLVLFVGKLIVGLSINSKAIELDSINSLSDSLSCAFIVLAALLSAKNPDRRHPFGYGRLEYVFSLLFSMFIMYVGIKAIVESVGALLDDAPDPQYNLASIIIMIISMVFKIGYGLMARSEGKKVGSTALVLSGTDSIGDSLAALSILVGMLLQKFFGFGIEYYLCIFIALLVVKTGFSMMFQCLNRILGTRVDPEFSKSIRTMIINEDGVQNVSNLMIHDYGEGMYVGSVDIDVDDDLKAMDIVRITCAIKEKAKDMGLNLTSVGIGGVIVDSAKVEKIQDKVLEVVSHHKSIVRIHSFSADLKRGEMSFYVVQDFDKTDHERVIKRLHNELCSYFPGLTIEIFSSINAE